MLFRASLASTVLLLAGACGQAETTPKDEPTTDASPSASEPTEPASLDTTVIEPGKVGPFVVGMAASEALEKGLVRQPSEEDPCPAFAATEPFQDVAVVFSASEPKPELLGVLVKVKGPKTAEGIAVGSSIADAKTAYGDQLREEEGDYGDTVLRLYDGDRAMGFSSSAGMGPKAKIDAIEVFAKSEPVVWDGC